MACRCYVRTGPKKSQEGGDPGSGRGGTKVARFTASGAWPVKYNPSDLNAKGNEVVIELLELANDGIERVE